MSGKSWLVLDANGVAVNRVEWDGISDWAPPDGYTLAADDGRGLAVVLTAAAEWTFEQFLARFTDAEKSAIFSAPAWQIKAWIARASAADGINPADPLVLHGLQSLEAAGLIGKGRASAVVSS